MQLILTISMLLQMEHVSLFNCSFVSLIFIILVTCPNTIRRVFYRFNYSSITNIISTVDVYVLTDSLTPSTPSNTRITIQWNDIDGEVAANTTVPRGYNNDEALRFYRNGVTSYVAFPIPSRCSFQVFFCSKIFA